MHENRDVFAFTDDELGHTSLVQHHIDTGNVQPIRQKPYRVSPTVRNCIDEHVEKILDQGVIQPSVSPWATPVVLVKKKDGSERFCVDYRKLNSVTRRDSHPIPHVQDTLDCLHGTSYFSCMDLLSGYWQVEVDDESKLKTASATHGSKCDGITPDPSKIRAVKEFPVPRCTRDVRSFLGLANY